MTIGEAMIQSTLTKPSVISSIRPGHSRFIESSSNIIKIEKSDGTPEG